MSGLDLPDLDFRQLYYQVKLQPWARVPNFDPQHPRTGGFLQNAGIVEAGTKTKFRYREGDLHPERWVHPERAWIMFHDSLNYETQFCPVKAVDRENRVVEAQQGVYVLSLGNPFCLCGLPEELDAPGEWCVDPDSKTLYFWPPQPLAGKPVYAPHLRTIVELEKGTSHVAFRGLTFEGCEGTAVVLRGVLRIDARGRFAGFERTFGRFCGAEMPPDVERCLIDYFRSTEFPIELRNLAIAVDLGRGLKC